MDVAILDYGTGNLHSLAKGLQAGGAAVRIVDQVGDGFAPRALVLPGVGAFGAAAARLAPSAAAIRRAVGRGLPVLGICLGMQLLFDDSEEGAGAGLGLVPGHVRRVRAPVVPHMGWNDLVPCAADPLLASASPLASGSPLVAYYAHSFVAEPRRTEDILAWTDYGDDRFPAVVRRGSACGVQFHPEKSGAAGLRLLRAFLEGCA